MSDLDAVVQFLKNLDGVSVEIIVDNDNNFRGLVYVDAYMKNLCTMFPELILVDATHKLLYLRIPVDLQMPVYLLLCVDDGLSEIVCMFFVNAKTFCPSWLNACVVMSDKDFTERDAFTKCFPQASLNICLYDTLRSFRREITCDKMSITAGEQNRILDILTKLAYSKTHFEYTKHHQELDSVTRSVRI